MRTEFWRQLKTDHNTHCSPLQSPQHQVICHSVKQPQPWASSEGTPGAHIERALWNQPTYYSVFMLSVMDLLHSTGKKKSNFYLLSTVPFLIGFKHVTWNYSEMCHGKGAPDDNGGAVKRDADLYVRCGGELQTPLYLYRMLTKKSGSNITYHWINDESIQKYDELIPATLTAVK